MYISIYKGLNGHCGYSQLTLGAPMDSSDVIGRTKKVPGLELPEAEVFFVVFVFNYPCSIRSI